MGQAFVKRAIKDNPKEIIIFSRDEYKQYRMKQKWPDLTYIIGDIRDYVWVDDVIAMTMPDIIINFAALKHIDVMEIKYNTLEAVRTNIDGSGNIARAARKNKIDKVICISTDKACEPVSVYGYTKAISEKIFLDAKYSILRLGNVVASRGAVIWYFKKLKDEGVETLPITDASMTRFWMDLDQVPKMIYIVLEHWIPGRIYVPKLPAFVLGHLVEAMGFGATEQTGLRKGERMHEILFDDYAWDLGDFFILNDEYNNVKMRYQSNDLKLWLTKEEIKERLDKIFEEKQCV